MDESFFHAGGVYRHDGDGTPGGTCLFVVVHVGRPPEGFGHPNGAGEVAFGWRRCTLPDGTPAPRGSYATADFTGWHEIGDSELAAALGDTPLPRGPAPPVRARQKRSD
ncbi:hypothetical protein [Streptomyces sp. NRRL B-24484]|uniref:hypothetical protein n=1 Tax=Streptomyces sp. NRRL B-24484 TaxID=1463833 RepID=UPI0004BEB460|nr:hypothetical protein [Streptomyces sp. NRRL B-24484]